MASHTFHVRTRNEAREPGGWDSAIMTVPEAARVRSPLGDALNVVVLGVVLRRASETMAANLGERLHHADWIITGDPAEVERSVLHDCVKCRAGTDQALAYLAEDPTREVLVGLLYWAR